jgi:CheY-like chemotaxis protein
MIDSTYIRCLFWLSLMNFYNVFQMPVMNGLEATRLIRAEEQKYGIHMPIIALTAHIEPELIRSMYNHGIDLHVSKLVNVAEVLEQIRCIDSKKR